MTVITRLVLMALLFLTIGDSVADGRGTNLQTYSGTHTARAFSQADTFINPANDPYNSGNGSQWPLLARLIDAGRSSDLNYVACGTGGTDVLGAGVNQWASGQSSYTGALQQVTDSALGAVTAVLGHLGPNAIIAASTPTQANYKTAIEAMAAGFNGLSGTPKTFLALCGQVTTGTPPDRRAAEDHVRQAIRAARTAANSVIRLGPNLIHQAYSDGVHPKTDAQLQEVADCWYLALAYGLWGGTAHPPVPASLSQTDATHLLLTFDQDLSNTNGASLSGFRLKDNGSVVTLTSAVVQSPNKVILTAAASIVGTPTVDFGSNDDVAGHVDVPLSVAATLPDARTRTLVAEPLSDLALFTSSGHFSTVFAGVVRG